MQLLRWAVLLWQRDRQLRRPSRGIGRVARTPITRRPPSLLAGVFSYPPPSRPPNRPTQPYFSAPKRVTNGRQVRLYYWNRRRLAQQGPRREEETVSKYEGKQYGGEI